MNKLRVERTNCERCILLTPFLYAKCLNRVLNNNPTICETEPPGKMGVKERIRIVLQGKTMTKKEIEEEIPEFKPAAIGYQLSRMSDVVSSTVPGQRWSVYRLK